MHLTDDATKLKLFMDVLDGTKAAVSHQGTTHVHLNLSSHFCFFYISIAQPLTVVLHPSFFCLSQLAIPMSVSCLRLGSMMATLLLILLKQWKRFPSNFFNSSIPTLHMSTFVSYKLIFSHPQCCSNSSWHPVAPLPHPGERPPSWPAADGENQSQNLLCPHFCAADSGT